jgi:hypothetical protein
LPAKKQRSDYKRLAALISGLIVLPFLIAIAFLLNYRWNYLSDSQILKSILFLICVPVSISIGFAIFSFYQSSENSHLETLKLPWSRAENQSASASILFADRIISFFMSFILTYPEKLQQSISLFSNNIYSLFHKILEATLQFIVPFSQLFFPFSGKVRNLMQAIRGPGLRMEQRTSANKGMRQTVINSIFYTFIVAALFAILAVIIHYITNITTDKNLQYRNDLLINSICIGALVGIVIGGFSSSLPYVQHVSLRFILWTHGYIPLNYGCFIESVGIEYKFLERAGGSYRFVHPLLQQHFTNEFYKLR